MLHFVCLMCCCDDESTGDLVALGAPPPLEGHNTEYCHSRASCPKKQKGSFLFVFVVGRLSPLPSTKEGQQKKNREQGIINATCETRHKWAVSRRSPSSIIVVNNPNKSSRKQQLTTLP